MWKEGWLLDIIESHRIGKVLTIVLIHSKHCSSGSFLSLIRKDRPFFTVLDKDHLVSNVGGRR